MSKYDGAKIEVGNWEDYNPRTETKRPSWFRFENDLATSEKLFGLTCEQKWLWLVILSLLSRRNGEAITWKSSYVQAVSGVSPKVQDQTLEIFESLFDLRVTRTEPHETRTDACKPRALRDETRRDETNETNTHKFDFDSLYQKFPRKLGKEQGLKKARKEITSPELYAALSGAISRFADHHREKGTEAQFIPYFSTFMASWRDWLDPDVGSADSTVSGGIDWSKVNLS